MDEIQEVTQLLAAAKKKDPEAYNAKMAVVRASFIAMDAQAQADAERRQAAVLADAQSAVRSAIAALARIDTGALGYVQSVLRERF